MEAEVTAPAYPAAGVRQTGPRPTITGNDGNNIIVGGAGNDTFIFAPNFGHDTVGDYTPGSDSIQADHNLWATVADLLAHAADDGHGNVVVTADAQNAITLNNTSVSVILQHQNDFHIV